MRSRIKVEWDVHYTVLKGFGHTWNSLDPEANQQQLQKEHEELSKTLHFILSTYFCSVLHYWQMAGLQVPKSKLSRGVPKNINTNEQIVYENMLEMSN